MKKRSFYRMYISKIIACCLAVIFCLEIAPQLWRSRARAEEKIIYISEVKLFQHDEYLKAIEACQNEGFTPLGNNLNEGTGEDTVILGYKTTENRDEAITDLSVLQMGSGYQYNTYQELLKAQRRQFDLLAEEVSSLLPEFQNNLDKKSPAAETALRLLNYFYYDEYNKPLGSVLLEFCNPAAAGYDAQILPALLQSGSAGLFNAIMSSLIPAVADYNPDTAYVPGKYKVKVDAVPEIKNGAELLEELTQTEETVTAPSESLTEPAEEITEPPMETDEPEAPEASDGEMEVPEEPENPAEDEAEPAESTEYTEETDTAQSTAASAGEMAEPAETTELAAETDVQTEETAQTTDVPAEDSVETVTETTAAETITAETITAETITAETITAETAAAEATAAVSVTGTTATTEEEFAGDPEFNPEGSSTDTQSTETTAAVVQNEFVLNCDMNYGSWASRICRTGMVELYKNGKITDKEQKVYDSAAREIRQAVQDFAADYQNAAARMAAYGIKAILPQTSAENSIDASLELVSANMANGGKDSDTDAYVLSTYNLLDQYMYDENTTVAEYIVQAGCAAYTDAKESFYQLYPLAAAMTNGQLHMMQVHGIPAVAMYLENTEEIRKTADGLFKELEARLKPYSTDGSHVSVWYGVDKTMFSKTFAVTDTTIMKQQSGAQLKTYQTAKGFEAGWNQFMEIYQITTTILGAVAATMTLVSQIGVMAGVWQTAISASACWAYATSGGAMSFLLGGSGALIMGLSELSLYAMIAILLVQVGIMIYKTYWYEEDEVDAKFKSSIPSVLVDINDVNEYIYYDAVRGYGVYSDVLEEFTTFDQTKVMGYKDNPDADVTSRTYQGAREQEYTIKVRNRTYGDLNAGEGKDDRWLALYSTKAENAGSPLRLDTDGSCFFVKHDGTTPAGYEAVNNFNESVPANLNAYVDTSDAPYIYLFYKTEYSIENPVSTGSDQVQTPQAYLHELKLFSGANEDIVLDSIQKEGYLPINGDLTASLEDCVTYLGYKSGTELNGALTDIRVLPKKAKAPDQLKSYTLLGETKTGDKIYTSVNIGSGQPILAEFNVISGYDLRKPAYRAMTTFDEYPYDFSRAKEGNAEGTDKTDAYQSLYVTYKQAQQYLTDLTVRTGHSRDLIVREMQSAGYLLIDRNLTPEAEKYTYLGYKASGKADGCVTDIRILPKGESIDKVSNSGWYRLVGKTAHEDTIYYSTNDRAGAAIIADFGFLSDYAAYAAGSEKLISTFGKQPFDFEAAAAYDPDSEKMTTAQIKQLAEQSDAQQKAQQTDSGAADTPANAAQPEKSHLFISFSVTRKPQYVTEVSVASFYGNESGGKQALIDAGFTVLNVNLTPGVFRTYTYFGYKARSTESNTSVCDIRVGTETSARQVTFGSGTYGLCAGQNQKLGIMPQGDALYVTSFKSNGDAILADFVVVNDPKQAPAGYEPIMTFGGVPYNFDRCITKNGPMKDTGGWYMARDGLYDAYRAQYPPVFIYYRPSVAYPAINADGSAAAKYISGITTFVGNKEDCSGGNVANKYARLIGSDIMIDKYGPELMDNLMYGWGSGTSDEESTETDFIVNYTYHPKRALYDLKSYTALPGADKSYDTVTGNTEALPMNLVSAGSGYITEEVVLVLREDIDWSRIDAQYIGYSPTHDWFTWTKNMDSYGDSYFEDYDRDPDMDCLPESFETTAWEASTVRAKNIYGAGPTEGLTPIRADDLLITNQSVILMEDSWNEDTSWTPVVDFRIRNSSQAANLSYHSKKIEDQENIYQDGVYIFFKGKRQEKKKYIKSVSVAVDNVFENFKAVYNDGWGDSDEQQTAWNLSQQSYNNCLAALLSSCTDEILPNNLSTVKTGKSEDEMKQLFEKYVRPRLGENWRENAYYIKNRDNSVYARFDDFQQHAGIEYVLLASQDNYQNDTDQTLIKPNYIHPVVSSFLGVSRTDTESEAIRGLLKYKPENGSAPNTITVDGMTYTKCSPVPVMDIAETYYLYQTTSLGAGDPITEIDFDYVPYISQTVTVPTAVKEDTPGSRKAAFGADEESLRFYDRTALTFIHCRTESSANYLGKLYAATGQTESEAMFNLLDMGAVYIITENLNLNTSKGCTMLGYSKVASTKFGAIQDILLIVGKQPTLSKSNTTKVNKMVYYPLMMNGKPFCLNEKDNTYLYYRTTTNNKAELPFANIGIAERDRVPDSRNLAQPWENILTFKNERYNLNNGKVIRDLNEPTEITDNRLYLYGQRITGTSKYIKPGAEITGGHCDEMMEYGDMMISLN